MSRANAPKIMLLTGPREVGKTTWILELCEHLRSKGRAVFGVATPKIFADGNAIGIAARDLATGRQVPLAYIDEEPGIRIGPWRFSPEGIEFGNRACAPRPGKGPAVIDEIGPLELQGKGFSTALDGLKQGRYPQAIVVVRPKLADQVAAMIFGRVAIQAFQPDVDFDNILELLENIEK